MVLPVLLCIRDQHDIRLVMLAGLICVLSALAAILLLRHARDSEGFDRLRWSGAAALASGFGIWATHFVAMLGYDPGFFIGYHVRPTLLSLAIAVVALIASFSIALYSQGLRYRWVAGTVAGCGIAAMHYTGMHAIELPAKLIWAPSWVALSIVFSIAPLAPSLILALDRRSTRSAFAAGLLLGVAVLLLHFTAMTAVTIIPSASDAGTAESVLSSVTMGYVIGGVALAVLLVCLITVLVSARMRNALRVQERQFGLLVQGINDCAIYMLDPAGRVMSWNAGAQRLKGYTAGEIAGSRIDTFYLPEDRLAGIPESNLRHAREHGRVNAEGWRLRKDGSRFWAHVTIESVHDERGVFKGYAKLTRDMTSFKASQDQLVKLAGNLDTALSNMRQGLCLFDEDERLLMSNARVGEMFGVSTEDCPIGTPFAEVLRAGVESRLAVRVSDDALNEIVQRHRACMARPGGGTMIVPMNDATLSISHRPMPDGGWVTTFDDVTERYRADARIAHMAMHDELTGLPNRPRYIELLDRALVAADAERGKVAVLGIDLDRFKEINDLHGHAVGDQVLRELADRMRAMCNADEVVARFGGDEFAAFTSFRDATKLDHFVRSLETMLNEPIELSGLTIFPGASIGVAVFPDHGSRRETIVNNADLAMYRAKQTLGERTCFYSQEMDEAARTRRILANDLREAITRDELSLAYQVQRSIPGGNITGYEALLRWNHPRDGWISPAEFIPIAEESGEIVRIGEWVLRTACTEAAAWAEPLRVAVNLSPIQLMQPELIGIVTSALVSSGLPAHRLELEITETAFISDKIRALHVLRQIKALGVSIAIDDFGTGYSSLDTLNSFPFDKIKIDRSFLMQSETSRQARAIIRAVVALGHSLDVPVLAEGLESADQLRLLRLEGCDEAQGYYFGRPMTMEDNLKAARRGAAA